MYPALGEEKEMKNNEHSLRDLWEIIRSTRICKESIPEEPGRGGSQKKHLKRQWHKASQVWWKHYSNIQKAQQTPNQIIFFKTYMPRDIKIKLSKDIHKNLENRKRELIYHVQGLNKSNSQILIRIHRGQKAVV